MSENTNVAATNLETCRECGFQGRTDGPYHDTFHTHSCIEHLKEELREAKSISQINHEAAERCAGERAAAIEFARNVENENGMMDFDMKTLRVQRDNAQYRLSEVVKDMEFYKMELQRTRDCLTCWHKLIRFFTSVIKSGEGWSRRCETELEEAQTEFLKLRERPPITDELPKRHI